MKPTINYAIRLIAGDYLKLNSSKAVTCYCRRAPSFSFQIKGQILLTPPLGTMQRNTTQQGSLKAVSGQQVDSQSTTLKSARVLVCIPKAAQPAVAQWPVLHTHKLFQQDEENSGFLFIT